MFNSMMAGPSLSDIAALLNGGGGGFGGNNGWWILIILFAIFGGWGNRGYGNNGYSGGGGGAMDGYILTSDFATLERKADSINQGLCDGFYAQNTNMLTGFNTLGSKIDNCCCTTREAISRARNDVTIGFNNLSQAITMAAQNIINNDNANYRQLHDENIQMQLAAKDDIIAQLRSQRTFRDISEVNANQTQQLLARLQPPPVPAWQVPNPYAACNSYNGYGCGGCGCNNNDCCRC